MYYNRNYIDSSTVRVFVLLFSFSIFRDRRSLKLENENNRAENNTILRKKAGRFFRIYWVH